MLKYRERNTSFDNICSILKFKRKKLRCDGIDKNIYIYLFVVLIYIVERLYYSKILLFYLLRIDY